MTIHDPTGKPLTPEQPSAANFWHHRTLAELAEAQGVRTVEDVRVFYGTWPGEPDDGFEHAVAETR